MSKECMQCGAIPYKNNLTFDAVWHSIRFRLNPVWTVDTGSLFLVSCSAEEFFSNSSGLTFHIHDLDAVTKDDLVAFVSISQPKLLQMNGKREPFHLETAKALKKKKKNLERLYRPKLYLRVRRAKPEDRVFMEVLQSIRRSKKEGVHADHSFTAPTKERVGLLRRETKVVKGVTLVSMVCCVSHTLHLGRIAFSH